MSVARFCALGGVVLSICGTVFGPFLFSGAAVQIFRRLFPVSRGLLHAYWAPNFWALYAATDKALRVVLLSRAVTSFLPKFIQNSLSVRSTGHATLTGGLVGEASFSVLPDVGSGVTMLCVLCAMLPCLVATWHRPLPGKFARAAVCATLSAYLFGYHVHEKAILMPLVPLAVLAAGGTDREAIAEFAFLSIVGNYSLFPLLIRKEEYGIKVMALAGYLLVALPWLQNPDYWSDIGALLRQAAAAEDEDEEDSDDDDNDKVVVAMKNRNISSKKPTPSLVRKPTTTTTTATTTTGATVSPNHTHPSTNTTTNNDNNSIPNRRRHHHRHHPVTHHRHPLFTQNEALYLWALIPLEAYCCGGHLMVFGPSRLPFLPLMMTSVYCSLGIMYCWWKMTWRYCCEVLQIAVHNSNSSASSSVMMMMKKRDVNKDKATATAVPRKFSSGGAPPSSPSPNSVVVAGGRQRRKAPRA